MTGRVAGLVLVAALLAPGCSVARLPETAAAREQMYKDVPVGYRFEDIWAQHRQSVTPYTWAGGGTPVPVIVTNPPPSAPPPPAAPPYVPPGPGWLSRAGGAAGGAADVGGATTIIVKLDGRTIGEAILPTVHTDARSGKTHSIIVETVGKR